MENPCAATYVFGHATLLDIWTSNTRSDDALKSYLMEKVNCERSNENLFNIISNKTKVFLNYIKKHLPSCCRNIERFKEKHPKWLAGSIIIKICDQNEPPQKMGRPQLAYEDAGPRLRRKLASEVALENKHSTPLLLHAARVSAKTSNDSDMHFVLKTIASTDNIGQLKNKLISVEATPISAESALAYLIENGLTKQQYINTQQLNKDHGCDIYPPYLKLVESKLKCRPVGIVCSDNEAKVPLQNLLDHTASRILSMQEEVCEILPDVTQCTLIFSYGFDGSTGHSLYKQNFEVNETAALDNSLFVTTMIPLKLVDQRQRVIWLNRSPQSIRFCRPLKIEFVKESTALIVQEKENLENQIQNLSEYLYLYKTKKIFVQYDGHMTLIDGKVLNILTGTQSCQSCPICSAKPTQLLHTRDFNSSIFSVKPNTLQYGISPLHAWIRFFEFILRISYRVELKKWHIKGNDKLQLAARKQLIQTKFWKEMGLHVDKPRANGSGNSNDGNTARRAFSNPKLLSSILQIDFEIIHRFHIILIAISCHYKLNSEKFKTFCFETFTIYMENYSWYPMSPTVHKVLVHGYKILESCIVPVGSLGESASEARHKLFKSDRRSHARKCSRVDNMSDVFHSSMDSSDPLLSSLCLLERQTKKRKNTLPAEVIALLDSPSPTLERVYPSQSSSNETDEDHDADDDEQDDEEDDEHGCFGVVQID